MRKQIDNCVRCENCIGSRCRYFEAYEAIICDVCGEAIDSADPMANIAGKDLCFKCCENYEAFRDWMEDADDIEILKMLSQDPDVDIDDPESCVRMVYQFYRREK